MSPIAHIRKSIFGLSQAEFGGIVGVSQGTVSKWESGEGAPDRNEMALIRNAALERSLNWDDSLFFEVPATPSEKVAS